jgi:hypothetical protein
MQFSTDEKPCIISAHKVRNNLSNISLVLNFSTIFIKSLSKVKAEFVLLLIILKPQDWSYKEYSIGIGIFSPAVLSDV